MAAQVQFVEVDDVQQMDMAISSWVVNGYVLANKTSTSATMVKRKEFSVLWAVVGLVLCALPLLIYLVIYAAETDKVVEIRVKSGATTDGLAELEKLAELRERGVITEEEYEAQKRSLGYGTTPPRT